MWDCKLEERTNWAMGVEWYFSWEAFSFLSLTLFFSRVDTNLISDAAAEQCAHICTDSTCIPTALFK